MKYQTLITDKFKSNDFSRNELDLFAAKLIANAQNNSNSVLPKAEESLLVTAHQNFKANKSTLTTESGLNKGGTITREDAYDDALDFIRRKEGLIKDTFGKGTAEYVNFYPQGLTEYNQATVEGMKDLLARFVTIGKKHVGELGQPFVDQATALQDAYANARDSQVEGQSTNKSAQTILRESRKVLTMQLTRCLHLIAAYTIENPLAYNSYFDWDLLEVDNDKTPPSEPIETDK
jgi:hypothetical protein